MRTSTVSMSIAISFLAASILSAPVWPVREMAPLHGEPPETAQAEAGSRGVPSTAVEAALDELRRRFPNQIVIGFEELFDPRPESEPYIDLGPADTTLAAAIERVRRVAPRYRVDLLEQRLVHVYPAQGTADPLHLLDIRLKEFDMPQDCCLCSAIANIDQPFVNYAPELAKLLVDRRAAWDRAHGRVVRGYAGDILGYCYRDYAPGPAYFGITVREALNRMALRSLQVCRGEVEPNSPIYGKFAPLSWKFRFRRERDADAGLGGVPLFQTF